MTTPQEERTGREAPEAEVKRPTDESVEMPTDAAHLTIQLIPDSEYLRQYEKLHPGSAERILRMVEDERKLQTRRDRLRFIISVTLMLFLVIIVVVPFVVIWTEPNSRTGNSAAFVAGVSSALVGVIIAVLVTQFYYRDERRGRGPHSD